jgi:hypothetical protein
MVEKQQKAKTMNAEGRRKMQIAVVTYTKVMVLKHSLSI